MPAGDLGALPTDVKLIVLRTNTWLFTFDLKERASIQCKFNTNSL